MRCPKCHYITFEGGDRCRNCGYDFSLAVDIVTDDLPIQTGDEPLGPLADFALSDLDTPPPGDAGPAVPVIEAEPVRTVSDLPLFTDGFADEDRPLVNPAAIPRPPLAVRRSSPVLERTGHRRTAVDEPSLGLSLEEPEPVPEPPARDRIGAREPLPAAAASDAAPAGARLLGGLIDLLILGSIDALVLYFTLRICGLQVSEIAIIPPIPFIVFLSMMNGGYFIGFTVAGGQTIGKMAASTRVVPLEAGGSAPGVPVSQATLRTALYLVSLLPAGAGFLPAFLGDERRALHDRLAATRVIRA